MKQAKAPSADEVRSEYRRADLGRMVRGKYVNRLAKRSNLVLIDPAMTKAFPASAAVNKALGELPAVARRSTRVARRSSDPPKPAR